MKNIMLFLFIITGNFCLGQGVRFKLYRTKACTTVEKLDTDYFLIKIPGTIDCAISPILGTAHLPGRGSYKLNFIEGPYIDTLIEIRDTGLFVFRFKEPDVGLYDGGMDMPMVYKSCGKLVDGYFESFYPDGKIKMRGDFAGGYVKDSMVTFYNNSFLKSRRLHFRKKTTVEAFDSLANRIKISSYQNGPIISYRWSRTKEFFSTGKLKLKESDVNRVDRIEEFYPNGQLKIKQTKRRRTEYYESGTKKLAYKWKKKLELFEPHENGIHDFTVYKTEYNEDGKVLQLTIYEVWYESGSPPRLELADANWLISLTKFKDGKEIDHVKDINMKDFPKK